MSPYATIFYAVAELAVARFLWLNARFYQPLRALDSAVASAFLVVGAIGNLISGVTPTPLFAAIQNPFGDGESVFVPLIVCGFVFYTDIFLRTQSWLGHYFSCPLFNIDNETLTVRHVLQNQAKSRAHDKWIDQQRKELLQPKIQKMQQEYDESIKNKRPRK